MKKYLFIFTGLVFVWVWITNTVQAFLCTDLTQTELFLRLCESFILDFKIC